MRFLAIIIITLLCLTATSCNSNSKRHTGVFSNEAEGFKVVTLMVHEDGLAYLHTSVIGQIGEWEFDYSESILSFKVFDSSTKKDQRLNLKFDRWTRTYKIIKSGKETKDTPPYGLHFISAEIPDKLIEAFKAYPAEIKRIKARAAAELEFKRRRQEQLERERPEYERIVAQIKAEPRTVLAKEFHSNEITDFGQFPIQVRAFRNTLSDHDVAYPEQILIELLNRLPDDRHSLRVLLFRRPELTGETLTHFYPRALEWGKSNYSILANIAEHPNTPHEIIRDLAGRKGLAIGAIQPAQKQMTKYAEKLVAPDSGASLEECQELYDFALTLQKGAYSDYGKSIALMLARGSNTPTTILTQIAQTDDQAIQKAIISNTNTPLSTIHQLATSRFPKVREDVATTEAVPLDILLLLSKDDAGRVRAAVATQPTTPVAILTEMQSDEYYGVRRNLIRNPNTPVSVLKVLITDKNHIIKSAARSTLRKRQVQK